MIAKIILPTYHADMRTFELPEVAKGEFLGDYQVMEVLGRGPTGTTYHVMSNVLQKEFALKTLRLSEEASLSWIDRLEAQTALLSKFNDPHVDQVISSGRHGDLWYCVKDFIHDGEGLSCHLDEYRERFGGKLSHFQVAHLTFQIAKALEAAANYRDTHHRGIHHGNLKPENILVAYSSRPESHGSRDPFEVKLSDFQPYGLFPPETVARFYHQWESTLLGQRPIAREKAIPQVLHSIYKTFDYLAPELEEGGKPTASGDMFALGTLAYEMLTGSLPVGRFSLPSQVRQDIPVAWDELITTLLDERADCRFHGFNDLLKMIEEQLLIGPEFNAQPPEEKKKESDEEEKEKPKERLSLTPSGMVYLPASAFLVGSADCGQDALPQHEVESAGFYMDRTPVTNVQFAKFVEESGYITEAEQGEGAPIWVDGEWRLIPGINWRTPMGQRLPDDFDNHPVTQVTFADAIAYCEWAGRRLPTEEEWEQAARGGLASEKFPWGSTIGRVQANYNSEGTSSVMSYQANGYGLYDMAGNVWEWTSSWYKAYPGNHLSSPHFGEQYRVVRGGAWMYDGAHCMVSYRNANDPAHAYPTLGFRTVVDFQCELPASK